MKIMAFFCLFLSSCCLFLNVQHSHIFLFYVIFLWLFLSACFPYMTGTMGSGACTRNVTVILFSLYRV